MTDAPSPDPVEPKKPKAPKRRHITVFPQDNKAWVRFGVFLAVALLLPVGLLAYMTSMPGSSHSGPLKALSKPEQELSERLKKHVVFLAETLGQRNHWYPEAYDKAAEAIDKEFKDQGWSTQSQTYSVNNKTARNIIAELPGQTRPQEILVIGAHYDSCRGTPGANDNASGVAALLELGRMLKASKQPFARTLRLVAFANEEPPFFWTKAMGSLVYARACKKRGDKIVGMISLETMGYFSEQEGSQQYPFPFNTIYPSKGHFIGFVGDMNSRSMVREMVGKFREHAAFPSEGVAAPKTTPGIGWSDHWSFWQIGVPAVMVTDTAPFRYRHYHRKTDTPEKLDYERMARILKGLEKVVVDLANKEQ